MIKKAKLPSHIEVVTNPYEQDVSRPAGVVRKGLMVGGAWDDSIQDYIEQENVTALYFNSARGWKDNDYSFLESLGSIQSLHIISGKSTQNLSSIEGMESLQEISLTCNTDEIIDFLKFPHLKKCMLTWWKGAESIFHTKALEELYLDELKIKDYSVLASLTNLNYLTIGNSTIKTLGWLPSENTIRELALLNCRQLSEFCWIKKLEHIRRLTISGSKKLTNLNAFSQLYNLEILDLSDNGELDSLTPLTNCKKLKAMSFSGNTNVLDGNLSVLTELPILAMLMFQARKHYNCKLIKQWDWANLEVPDVLLKAI